MLLAKYIPLFIILILTYASASLFPPICESPHFYFPHERDDNRKKANTNINHLCTHYSNPIIHDPTNLAVAPGSFNWSFRTARSRGI